MKPRLSHETAYKALKRVDAKCECGCHQIAYQWHHVFPQNKWPELVDNIDNIVAVNIDCHARHTNAYKRFPRSICKRAEHLATTDKMRAYLDNTYDNA